jgi:hypothetical protein
MCFEADAIRRLNGVEGDDRVESPFFARAPQRTIYPKFDSRPSSAEVTIFLKRHGIDYIYVDPKHPNSLVSDAIPIVSIGEAQVLRIP